MPARAHASHALAAPTAGVFRVAASAWPFAFLPPRSPLVDDGHPVLGGNRWDDPRASFATCASSAEAAFAETIARYRDEPGLLERIDTFLTAAPDEQYDFDLRPGGSSPSAARSARGGSRERAAAIRARSRALSSARVSLRCCRTSPRARTSAGNAASAPAVARAETGSGQRPASWPSDWVLAG